MSKKNLVFKRTLVAHALTVAFGVAVFNVAITQSAMAQSNTAGVVYGKVAPGSATSVVLKNLDTNQSRTVAVDATGAFNATAMAVGRYKATLMKGSTAGQTADLEVLAGQGVEAVFTAADLQTVKVSTRRTRIDISSANNGATFTARELAKLPIAQNVDAIIQLAPNTTRADPRYAGGASFAGGGASENAYYINGFPVTNPLTQLGASELPFGAIAQAQILTGGFGAEFGRSVGGVVNIITKSGTNNWEFGVTGSISPKSLRAKPRDIYYENVAARNGTMTAQQIATLARTNNTLYIAREENTRSQEVLGAYIGGPIIKDKLFMFVSAETTRTDTAGVGGNGIRVGGTPSQGWNESKRVVDRYLGKFNWNITDNHALELTLLGDTPTVSTTLSGFHYGVPGADNKFVRTRDGIVASRKVESNVEDNGAEVQILKYTGNLTDKFTVQALYGRSSSEHKQSFEGYNPNMFSTLFSGGEAPGITYVNRQTQPGNILPPGAKDQIESFRLDLEYKLGDHTIRFGLDKNKLKSVNAGETSAGGGNWSYQHADDPFERIELGGGFFTNAPASTGSPLGLQGYYVTKDLFTTVTDAYSNQDAQYIEDKWQVTKNLLVTGGIRVEGFDNQNGDKVKYLEQKNQIAPRLSAVWDVNGDASTKVFGSLGRYHLQIPTHLAVRGAGRSTNTSEYFTYTGVDANGHPTGLVQIAAPFSSNNEYGQAKEPKVLSAVNLKPTYQDEITIGFEKAYSPSLNFGAKATYRKLGSTIDDVCDGRAFTKYAADNRIDTSNWEGFGCANFNPGEANEFYVDYAGTTRNGGTARNLTLVKLSAADLGFPKAERTYTAVDLFIEHPFSKGWYGKLNYTWSRNKGNTEGQTLSDVAQTDVAVTQTWDYKELSIGANGLLPNDRTHQIKAYGFYEINPEWTVGGNLLLASGRPRNCLGRFIFGNGEPVYGNGPHYCGGATPAQNVLTPRGTLGNYPWDQRLDLNVVYKPSMIKGLSLKAEVFNVFNRQTVEAIDERWNQGTAIRSTTGRVMAYTGPRSAKLTVEYNKKF
jgi:TonB-dependent Receptor Plug Domain